MSTATGRVAGAGVPGMVAAGIDRCQSEFMRLLEHAPGDALGNALRAERLAVLCEREARWWEVLVRWTYGPQRSVSLVFGRAVIESGAVRRADAKFWSDMAGDWWRRASGQPVCAVIGCGCGGECGSAA